MTSPVFPVSEHNAGFEAVGFNTQPKTYSAEGETSVWPIEPVNQRAVIESNSRTYIFDTNISTGSGYTKESAVGGSEYNQKMLIIYTNRILYHGEMMRRGFGIIPADERLAVAEHGQALPSDLSFFRDSEISSDLLEKFNDATAGELPQAFNVARNPYKDEIVALSEAEISELFDAALMDEEFTPLMDHYHAHMDRLRNAKLQAPTG